MTFQPGKEQLLSISESEANQTMKFGKLGTVHMRWAGSASWAASPGWEDFYPTFVWNLLSHFNQKVC